MICLTPEELIDLTHRKRPSAQLKALRSMGIEGRMRPDNTVAVLRGAGGSTIPRPIEPDWSSIDAPQKTPRK